MPIEVNIVQQGMGRIWVCHGLLTGKELIANNERILSSKSYQGVRWLLIDETDTKLEVSTDEIRTIRRQDDLLAAVLPKLVTAVVIPRLRIRHVTHVGASYRAARVVYSLVPHQA